MTPEHVDVLIVGAGLSGIGAAAHLHDECPGRTFTILEARVALGGTWDLFRYPGVRSESDMFTLGYRFRPWTDAKAIADGASIPAYVGDTARERGIDRAIRYHHRVVRASWSSETARWTVTAERTDTGGEETFTCSFLSACSGYYRYDEGYTPELPGIEAFRGTVVHPQHWPRTSTTAVGGWWCPRRDLAAAGQRAGPGPAGARRSSASVGASWRARPPRPTRWCGGRTSSSPWRATGSAAGVRRR